MTFLDLACAVTFWIAICTILVIVGAIVAKKIDLIPEIGMIGACLIGAVFVAIVVDDLVIKPTMSCIDNGGRVSLIANQGMPGCTK